MRKIFIYKSPLILLGLDNKYNIKIYAIGGGLSSQSDAILRTFKFTI